MTFAFMSLGLMEMLFLAFVVCGFLIPLAALIDTVRSDFKGQNDKIMWVLIIILFPFIGSLLYFFIGRSQKIA